MDQFNLISRLKIDIVEPILSPAKINEFIKNIIEKCSPHPNKVKEPRTYELKTKSIK